MNWIVIAAINLALAVGLGAFGAHGLQKVASPAQLAWWHTGTQYFFYHALGLLVVGLLIQLGYTTPTTAWLLQGGIVIFVGSLFLMALGAPAWLGAVTPIGGLLMIAGWVWLAVTASKLSGH